MKTNEQKESLNYIINTIDEITREVFDEIIEKHLSHLSRPPFDSNIKYWLETGKINGSFRESLHKMMQYLWDLDKKEDTVKNKMLTNKKHTREPWYTTVNYAGHMSLHTTEDPTDWDSLLDTESYNNAEANAERACKCVNAMQGIEDPIKWVKSMREDIQDCNREINQLFKYKTACEQINPDNPMAVAENLKSILEEIYHHAGIILIQLNGDNDSHEIEVKERAIFIKKGIDRLREKEVNDDVR